MTSFRRAQIAAFVATAFDFATLITLVELVGLWYFWATVIGAGGGALLNFWLNRHWSFQAAMGCWRAQASRYVVTSGLSLLLNSGGVFLFTEAVGTPYVVSKVISSILVGFGFNYPMHRFFVFRVDRI